MSACVADMLDFFLDWVVGLLPPRVQWGLIGLVLLLIAIAVILYFAL